MAKPVLNQLRIDSYDRRWGRNGEFVDWVTESEYISEKSLTIDEFNEIISKSHQPAGELKYRKFKLTYGDGSIYYKHILEEVMY